MFLRSILRSAPKRSVPSARCYANANSPPPPHEPFVSILDNPRTLVRAGRKHYRPGLVLLAAIPIAAFALGTWQVQRLSEKTSLIAKYEDRLLHPPLPLPPKIDTSRIHEFDYRRVSVTGVFRHDQEMLIGPRVHEGHNGYQVVTPLERGEEGSTVLVNRGWIAKEKKDHSARPEGLPKGQVTVEGLLRTPWKKNLFTPENRPDLGEFYFPDVDQMAGIVGAQPVWIEETDVPDLIATIENEAKGVPIGRPAEVSLRNNHAQYIFTWYALSAATSVMFYMLVRKPPPDIARRVRQNVEWS